MKDYNDKELSLDAISSMSKQADNVPLDEYGTSAGYIIRNLISRIKELEDENEAFLKRLEWSYG